MGISDNNMRVYVTLPKDLHEWLKNEAAEKDRNVSNLINVILKDYKKQKEKSRQK